MNEGFWSSLVILKIPLEEASVPAGVSLICEEDTNYVSHWLPLSETTVAWVTHFFPLYFTHSPRTRRVFWWALSGLCNTFFFFCDKPHLSTPLNKERLQVRYKWGARSCEWTSYRTGQKPNHAVGDILPGTAHSGSPLLQPHTVTSLRWCWT